MPEARNPADDDAFAALVLRYLDGVASPEEEAAMNAELADPRNAARREMFVSFCRQRGQIIEALAPERFEKAVQAAPRKQFRPARPTFPWKLLLTAAAVAVAAVSGYFLMRGEAPVPVAVVDRATGGVSRLAGEKLFAGDGIETDGRGSASLLFSDGTRVDLAAATKMQGLAAKGGKRFLVAKGKISADVAKQRADEPMIARTPEGEAKVLGTKLTLIVSAGRTRLDVEQGRVLLTRLSDRKFAEVAAGQYAESASDTEPVARAAAAALVSAMAPRSWLAIPDTAMSKVFPDKTKFPDIQGSSGSDAVIGAWSGGAFDPRRGRLVLWGGGYTDYHGNELYAFSIETMAWTRLTEPTARPKLDNDTNADGTPNGRATYNGLAVLAHADRFFALGGGVAGNGFAVCNRPWLFDFDSGKWTRRSPSGAHPPTGHGNTCSYDPATKKLWWAETSGLYSYDFDADRWSKHGDDQYYYLTGAIDPKRGLWVLVGEGEVIAIDLRSAALTRQIWKTSGGDAVVKKSNPGLDYDPLRDRITAWAGGAVYTLDQDTRAWTAHDAPGAPAPTPNGIYGRWRYVPSVDAFIAVTAASGPVHFYKPAK
jgi:ferric-dicitrate binding protein FerR (iron transport regulator)